tara:strand:+ start:5118 stop:5933 length:816 start_codon:yes stop_codon:yes gene_type:complete
MAFKFKVKKRPNLGQAVASAYTAGAVQGGTIALQNAMKEREERKQQSTKELNLFNSGIAGLPLTPENLSKTLPLKMRIAKGDLTANLAFEMLGMDSLDYQTKQEKAAEEEAELKKWQTMSEDPKVEAAEIAAMQSLYDDFTPKPPKVIEDRRIKEADIEAGVRPDPTEVSLNQIQIMNKREIDINRNVIKDISKDIKALEEKKANSEALKDSDFAVPFTSQDQEALDTAKTALTIYQQRLNNALNQNPVTNVQSNNQEPDPFEAYLDTSQQ